MKTIELQMQEALDNLVFKNTFLAYYNLIIGALYYYSIQALCFILLLAYKEEALKMRNKSKITFYKFLVYYHKDKVMRATIKYYKASKKLIKERGY